MVLKLLCHGALAFMKGIWRLTQNSKHTDLFVPPEHNELLWWGQVTPRYGFNLGKGEEEPRGRNSVAVNAFSGTSFQLFPALPYKQYTTLFPVEPGGV